jgi:hypothetical protein
MEPTAVGTKSLFILDYDERGIQIERLQAYGRR